MIEYPFKEEKDYAIFYAESLGQKNILEILGCGVVKSKEEAEDLSLFFWDMVDKSIENEKQGVNLEWDESAKS
jgi:hypothetical protein